MPLGVGMAAAAAMKFTNSTAVIPFKPADGQSQKQPYDMDGVYLWQFPSQIPWLISSANELDFSALKINFPFLDILCHVNCF